MWQRIQTLYLFVSGVAAALLLLLPMLTLEATTGSYLVNFTGVVERSWTHIADFNLVSFVLTALSSLISLVTIFLFKRRKLQIRLTTFSLLIVIGALAYSSFRVWRYTIGHPAELHITPWLFLPVLTLLCQSLAIRNIIKDDILVRASQRLR